jgi:ribosomal protein L39E
MTSPNPAFTLFQNAMNKIRLIEEQKQNSRLPTSLKSVDAVRQAREQNCSHFYRITGDP